MLSFLVIIYLEKPKYTVKLLTLFLSSEEDLSL